MEPMNDEGDIEKERCPAQEGIIRPGQTTPYRKATNAEIGRRIEHTAVLLANGYTKTEIHAALKEKFGLHWSTVERMYMPRAREVLLKAADKTREEVRGEAVWFYRQILRNPRARVCEQIQARRRIDDIYGIDAPRRTEQVGNTVKVYTGEALAAETKRIENVRLNLFGHLAE
jgi:hypothetical protein